jgi:hypothetical protein
MATEKAALRVTEIDFDSIKENLKTYLRSQSEFQDFDFEGSGMSVLLDILAYNTHYMAYYLNMVGNEMFLDSAQLRNSILSHAKLMNYVPGSKQGALSKLNITITPVSGVEDTDATSATIEKYTRFLGTDINGINYPFVALYSNTAYKEGGSFSFANVNIKQGEVITIQYLMDSMNESRRFEIPSSNVDIESILVNVQESTTNTDTITYTQAEDITELTGNSFVYFIEENESSTYTVYFGDDVIGKKPKDGSVVILTYLDNVGEIANNISRFVPTSNVAGYRNNVSIQSTASSYGGIEKESIEQIRYRAPYFYSTQNRAVTQNDYETLITKDYNNIDSVAVWGGEDNDPVIYGKVFISLKPKGNYFLTNLEKEKIKEELIQKRNVLTVTPEILDPEYLYLLVKGDVTYNSKLTTRTEGEILQLVKAAISDYATNELSNFSSIFRKTKLENYIENCEKSITGCDIEVFAQKRILIDTVNTKTYNINFGVRLEHSNEIGDMLSSYPSIKTYDSAFVERDIYFEQSPEISTGIDYIEVVSAGQNYSIAPTVTISGDGSGASATAKILSGRVVAIIIDNPGKNYNYATIALSGGDGSGASANIKLQNNKMVLRSYYYKENGEKVILNNNAGYIEHNIGKVYIDAIRIISVENNSFYDDNYLTLSAELKGTHIYPLRNRIVSIDDSDARSVQIRMIAE